MRALCAEACVRPALSGSQLLHLCVDFKLFDTVFVLGEEKCHLKHFLGRFKIKVPLEGHINEHFWAITPTYMHGFQNNFAQMFSLKSRIAI